MQVPKTCLQLRQGFGRLIRSGTDTGMVSILDPRIHTKSYGKNVIQSLPKGVFPCYRLRNWKENSKIYRKVRLESKKTLNLILLIGSFFSELLFAEPAIDTDFYKTITNWYELTLTSQVSEPLPKIVFNEDDPDFGKPNTATNKSRSDLLARKKAKEKLRIRLSQSLEGMLFDSNYSVIRFLQIHSKVRSRINAFITEEKETFDFQPIKNQLLSKATIHLSGKQGFLAYLPMEYGSEQMPIFSEEIQSVEFSGLVVDARHLALQKSSLSKNTVRSRTGCLFTLLCKRRLCD